MKKFAYSAAVLGLLLAGCQGSTVNTDTEMDGDDVMVEASSSSVEAMEAVSSASGAMMDSSAAVDVDAKMEGSL